jgi:hypothetical protein
MHPARTHTLPHWVLPILHFEERNPNKKMVIFLGKSTIRIHPVGPSEPEPLSGVQLHSWWIPNTEHGSRGYQHGVVDDGDDGVAVVVVVQYENP